MIYCLFDNLLISVVTKMSKYDQDPAGSIINCPVGPKDYGSANPYLDLTENLSDPEHWNNVTQVSLPYV
jgi:hypothetical protein